MWAPSFRSNLLRTVWKADDIVWLSSEGDQISNWNQKPVATATTTDSSNVHSNHFRQRPLLAGRAMLVRGDARRRGGVTAFCSRFGISPRNSYSLTCRNMQPVNRRGIVRSDPGLFHLGLPCDLTGNVILNFIFEVDALVRRRSAMPFFAISAARVLQGCARSSATDIQAA